MTKIRFCIKENGKETVYYLTSSTTEWTISKETSYRDPVTKQLTCEPIAHYGKLSFAVQKIIDMKIKEPKVETFKQLIEANKKAVDWANKQFGVTIKPIKKTAKKATKKEK